MEKNLKYYNNLSEINLNSDELGDLIGLSGRRVRQYAEKKVLNKSENNLFNMRENILNFINYLRKNASASDDVQALINRKLKAETEEREAKAERANLELDIKKGEVMSRQDIFREWTCRCAELRVALLNLPAQLAFLFPDENIRILVETKLENNIREILESWSRDGIYTPKKIIK